MVGSRNYIKKMTPFVPDAVSPIPNSESEKLKNIETDVETLSRKVDVLSDQIEFLVSKL